MAENKDKKPIKPVEEKNKIDKTAVDVPLKDVPQAVESVALASEQELKVVENKAKYLSPGQMVLKRFFRSRLSVIGLVTLIVLFVFSFLGPALKFLPFIWGERDPDLSQGKTSVIDYPDTYYEKISASDSQWVLINNLRDTSLVFEKAESEDSTTAVGEKLKRNLNLLYSAYDGRIGSFIDNDGETVFFEVVKITGSAYTIYIVEQDTSGSYVKINHEIVQRSVNAQDRNLNASPSLKGGHILGTDANGFDIFTRLMYGGRISLTLGFVVVFIETLLAILFGGLAGYFGKWVDNIIMRVIDILYCLPQMPILLIFSAILDGLEVDDSIRIYLLMIVLSIMGWAGMARVIRGQILYLREQEYMVACEALGLGVPRRITKHLIPNVMPLLIVQMTMGLGGIILTESTLSYLGLGIRHPAAAWGTMISTADDPIILSRYPNQWVPAGIMIVLAVLAFGFVGDGLRDAFDPKMRR